MACVGIRDRYCYYGFIFTQLREHLYNCLGFDYIEVPEDDED